MVLAPDDGAIDIVHLFFGGEQVEGGLLALSREGSLRSAAAAQADAASDPPTAAELGQRVAACLAAEKPLRKPRWTRSRPR